MSEENKKSESADSPKGKQPGLPVPTISLEKAVELMGKVWEHEKRNAAPVPAILGHWGYGQKSSGGFQAVASLKRYGLLEEQGSSEQRTLKLTQLALDLLKNGPLDAKEYHRLLKVAAMNPKAHKELWEKYGSELPSDATLQSYLVFDRHLPEPAAKQFIRVYKETISFAKITGSDTVTEPITTEETPVSEINESKVTLPIPLVPKVTPLQPPANPTSIFPMQATAIKYFAIPTDVGDAMIPMGMSMDDFNLFKGALELFKSKIVHKGRFPVGAIWKNNDSDKPVTIVGEMGEKDGVKYYQTQDGTGVPATELTFA
jgi:hypothetical protein